ncbi:hypothetical protein M514_26535 [Trichuris suis]|uniref:Uncharacterized protein n=1 Tax=Trichuris suis TaxID=68888 RepID=A0A085MVP1_9BILA|nr:hypothetical protein M514_26535 [Trichuris suis]
MSLAEHNVRWPEPNEGYPLTTFISHTQDTISTIQLYTEPYGRNVRVELICFVECQVELDNAVQSEKALTVRGVAMRMTEKLHLVHVTINVMEDIHSYVISEGTPFVSHDGRPQSNMIPYNGQQGVAAAVFNGDKEALASFAAHSS